MRPLAHSYTIESTHHITSFRHLKLIDLLKILQRIPISNHPNLHRFPDIHPLSTSRESMSNLTPQPLPLNLYFPCWYLNLTEDTLVHPLPPLVLLF